MWARGSWLQSSWLRDSGRGLTLWRLGLPRGLWAALRVLCDEAHVTLNRAVGVWGAGTPYRSSYQCQLQRSAHGGFVDGER